MKRFLFPLMALGLACVCCKPAQKEEQLTELQSTELKPHLCGGYSDPEPVTVEDVDLFRSVVPEPDIVPVHVSRQVVAGMNFRFYCLPDTVITIYRDLSGHCSILND